jgi:hypothetical protein
MVAIMRKVDHIEQQIRELSAAEFAELRDWVLAQDWAAWDAKIKSDEAAGRLGHMVSESKAEFDSGKGRKI